VEAAQKASSWSKSSGHLRAQILFYFAENLSLRRQEL
jgi:aldehyde dehydrogenase (NAD+)